MVTPGDAALRLYMNVFFLSNLSAIIYLFSNLLTYKITNTVYNER